MYQGSCTSNFDLYVQCHYNKSMHHSQMCLVSDYLCRYKQPFYSFSIYLDLTVDDRYLKILLFYLLPMPTVWLQNYECTVQLTYKLITHVPFKTWFHGNTNIATTAQTFMMKSAYTLISYLYFPKSCRPHLPLNLIGRDSYECFCK